MERRDSITLLEGGNFEFSDQSWVPASRERVFGFFCDPRNLERITPPWLRFRITNQSTPVIQQGTEFAYRLRIRGIPVRWVSRIEVWHPGQEFVDTQLSGPYALWHHTHRFEDRQGGTLMTDQVRFRLPGGRLAGAVLGRFVCRDVRKIFEYRAAVLSGLFCDHQEKEPDHTTELPAPDRRFPAGAPDERRLEA